MSCVLRPMKQAPRGAGFSGDCCNRMLVRPHPRRISRTRSLTLEAPRRVESPAPRRVGNPPSQPRRPGSLPFMSSIDPIELEPVTGPFKAEADARPRVPEPPPVRLVAVDDVRLEAKAGLEPQLDAFYVGILKFEREAAAEGTSVLRYKAENFRLRIVMVDRPVDREENLRMLGVAVPLLLALEHALIDREIVYERQKGLIPGQESLLLRDPAGNWLEITESRTV